MSMATELNGVQAGFQTRIEAMRASVRDALAKRKLYRQTRDELSVLTDRDLADLGMHRSMIKQVALEAAYGTAK